MSNINQLATENPLSLSDLLPVWSTANGDTRKASLTALLALFQSEITDPGSAPIFLPFVGGLVNALAGAPAASVDITAIANGDAFLLFPNITNTGPLTLAVDGLTPAAVKANGAACTGGESVAGDPLLVVSDGTAYHILASGALAMLTAVQTLTRKTLGAGTVWGAPPTVSIGADADGDTYYRAAGLLARLPKGAAAQVLAMNGGATAPVWSSAAVPGWTLIEAKIIAAPVGVVDFVIGIDGTYDEYVFVYNNVVPSVALDSLWVRFSQDAGATFKSGATDYAYSSVEGTASAAVASASASTGDVKIVLPTAISNVAASGGQSGEVRLFSPSSAVVKKSILAASVTERVNSAGASDFRNATAGGIYQADANAVNGFRFLMSTGNIASGLFKLYGVKKS